MKPWGKEGELLEKGIKFWNEKFAFAIEEKQQMHLNSFLAKGIPQSKDHYVLKGNRAKTVTWKAHQKV